MTHPVLTFVVVGNPVPKARARVVDGHAHTPAKTMAYEKHVGMIAMAAVSQCRGWRRDWQAYGVTVRVYRAARRGDLDNYVKAVNDSLNAVAFDDDAAVVALNATMTEDRDRPRVEVEVEMLGDEAKPAKRQPKRRTA